MHYRMFWIFKFVQSLCSLTDLLICRWLKNSALFHFIQQMNRCLWYRMFWIFKLVLAQISLCWFSSFRQLIFLSWLVDGWRTWLQNQSVFILKNALNIQIDADSNWFTDLLDCKLLNNLANFYIHSTKINLCLC